MVSELSEYNGWTNYFTWAVHRWLTNDELNYNLILEIVHTSERGTDCDDGIKKFVESRNPLIESVSMFTDILNYALDMVNWTEISGTLAEDEDKERWGAARIW